MMQASPSHRIAALDGRLSDSLALASMPSPHMVPARLSNDSLVPNVLGLSIPTSMSVAAGRDVGGPLADSHSCPYCEKRFNRPCDLNKHTKSHSRPFKCSYEKCKYFSLGWPTAKELDRHVNDKHSAVPKTYPCHFKPCMYESKRESNCKQHMEKSHGWRYLRTKSIGRRLQSRDNSKLAALPTRSPQSVAPKASKIKRSPQRTKTDFVLFPHADDHTSSDEEDVDGISSSVGVGGSQGSDMFIPWTSPDTRLRRRETFLQDFTERFSGQDELPVDPPLSAVGASNSHPQRYITDHTLSPSSRHEAIVESVPFLNQNKRLVFLNTRSLPIAPTTLAMHQRPTGPASQADHGRSSSFATRQFISTPSMRNSGPQQPPTSKRKEGDDQDDEHIEKKLKSCPRLEFNDNQMPDIFAAAHPETYNARTRTQYASCETEHKDISTLVRHLKRQPHRLNVQERYISSFSIRPCEPPAELDHAERGVCRRCWKVFHDLATFESHISSECEKISKGKREKWHILYDAFTPLAADPPPPRSNQLQRPLNGEVRLDAPAHGVEEEDSPNTAPSPTTIDLGPRVTHDLDRESELERLRAENRQLKALTRFVIKQARVIANFANLAPLSSITEEDSGNTEVSFGVDMSQFGQLASRRCPSGHDTPDPGCLVKHMNNQSTDVDVQEMMEDIQQVLSRTASGISGSDQSTIRHVSNSPRQPFEAYIGDISATKQHSVDPNNGPIPDRRPPTSLPDSGYETDMKRQSAPDATTLVQRKQSYTIAQSHDATGSYAPNNEPFTETTLSTHISLTEARTQLDLELDTLLQPRFSPELFTRQDEADAYYLSKDLMAELDYSHSQQSSSSFQS